LPVVAWHLDSLHSAKAF